MRYLRLYLHFLRFSFSKAMEFRLDFFFRIFMDINYYAVSICFYKVLYLHSQTLAGWNEAQMMVFVASFLFVDALIMTFISNNMWWFPFLINRGDLDYYLTRPVSSLFFLSLREFAANSFVNLIMSMGILVWSFSLYEVSFPWWKIVLHLSLLFLGCFLFYSLRMLLMIPVFWTQADNGLLMMFITLQRVMERPDGIFKGLVRKIFITIIPFSLIASFPTRILFQPWDSALVIRLLVTTFIFFFLLLYCWRFGLRNYSSASS